jgi:hypothetical protein
MAIVHIGRGAAAAGTAAAAASEGAPGRREEEEGRGSRWAETTVPGGNKPRPRGPKTRTCRICVSFPLWCMLIIRSYKEGKNTNYKLPNIIMNADCR